MGFVKKWSTAAAALDEVRREEIRNLTDVDVADAICILSQAFRLSLHDDPPGQSSGLVEQQALFMKGSLRWKT